MTLRASTIALAAFAALLLAMLFGVFGDPLALEDPGVFRRLRAWGPWAWAAAVALICADLVMPVPATSVIAGLGVIYGLALGGSIGTVALVAVGTLAYGLVRGVGRPAALLFAGEERLRGLESFFERTGAWALILTRGLPIVPEVIASLAGLARMPAGRFLGALGVGSLPTAFVFAAIGVGWSDRPLLALLIAYVLPILLLPLALRLMRR